MFLSCLSAFVALGSSMQAGHDHSLWSITNNPEASSGMHVWQINVNPHVHSRFSERGVLPRFGFGSTPYGAIDWSQWEWRPVLAEQDDKLYFCVDQSPYVVTNAPGHNLIFSVSVNDLPSGDTTITNLTYVGDLHRSLGSDTHYYFVEISGMCAAPDGNLYIDFDSGILNDQYGDGNLHAPSDNALLRFNMASRVTDVVGWFRGSAHSRDPGPKRDFWGQLAFDPMSEDLIGGGVRGTGMGSDTFETFRLPRPFPEGLPDQTFPYMTWLSRLAFGCAFAPDGSVLYFNDGGAIRKLDPHDSAQLNGNPANWPSLADHDDPSQPTGDILGGLAMQMAHRQSVPDPPASSSVSVSTLVGWILFGITNDSGGVIVLPNGGGGPVPPGGPTALNVEILLANYVLAGSITDERTRGQVQSMLLGEISRLATEQAHAIASGSGG